MLKINLPICDEVIKKLHAGDSVFLSGKIITARDAAHKRFYELIKEGKELPVDIKGNTIYYVGPAPAKPGKIIGPAGPTSSYRMDKYTPVLLDRGLKAMIGKGERTQEVIAAMKKNNAVYFAAIGGAAALISKSIVSIKNICYEDLGTEAVCEYTIIDFPCIVAIDSYGNDIYKMGRNQYRENV